MPAIDFASLPATMMRPFVVAIAHLPILCIVLFTCPMWVCAAFWPKSHGANALKFLGELRTWSADVVTGSASRRAGAR